MSLVLRCYCCGSPLGREIALVSMSPDSVDRVFVIDPEHLENLDDTIKFTVVTIAPVAPT